LYPQLLHIVDPQILGPNLMNWRVVVELPITSSSTAFQVLTGFCIAHILSLLTFSTNYQIH